MSERRTVLDALDVAIMAFEGNAQPRVIGSVTADNRLLRDLRAALVDLGSAWTIGANDGPALEGIRDLLSTKPEIERPWSQ